MIKNVKGNLLKSNCEYICHQVNCQGVMGSGIAKQIRERWPDVYYHYKDKCYYNGTAGLLGTIDIIDTIDGPMVVNMYSQADYGYNGMRFTSYDAFVKALEYMKRDIPYGSKVGFPKNIGCGLGGGNWNIISAIIEAVVGDYFNVYIYEFDPEVCDV